MNLSRLRAREGSAFDSTMTPMIDVIFQLQIFFLCTAGFAVPESILPTRLPDTGGAQPVNVVQAPPDLQIVELTLRGRGPAYTMELSRRRVPDRATLVEDLARLGRISADLPIILDIGPEVILDNVVHAYDSCLRAGLRKIHFAAHRK